MSIKKRKDSHLNFAKISQGEGSKNSLLSELGLSYEPCLEGFPSKDFCLKQRIGKKVMDHPLWFSSMTGGGQNSRKINKKLAAVAGDLRIGMGLGSCRIIMEEPKSIRDFDVKKFMPSSPLWANLGICQIDEWLEDKTYKNFINVMKDLGTDGLIVHINPTQEFLQKNGSTLKRSAISILQELVGTYPELPLMVKEVGQGMGAHSLKALSEIKLQGIEFAGLGGTNFALIELLTNSDKKTMNSPLMDLTKLGHSAKEMVKFWINLRSLASPSKSLKEWHVIVSGARGVSLLEDVALAKKVSKFNPFSIGLGYAALKRVHNGEKELRIWIDEYLKGFYYLWSMTRTLEEN